MAVWWSNLEKSREYDMVPFYLHSEMGITVPKTGIIFINGKERFLDVNNK